MKVSPSQIFKEAEVLKAALSGESLSISDSWQKRQELLYLFESLLLMDLDYALDKKVEQDLWSFIFRNPISACQSKAKEHKKSSHCYTSSQLSTLLETASGFYLQLLQKLCCAYDIDLPCHPRDSVYGLTKEWKNKCSIGHHPRKASLLYICQHCLVHLGDIARYRAQSLQAENFYRHAVDLVPSNGQPYNQLALLEAASGEKLSTVFFYVRSLCVQHPFPLAATNLQNLFSKMPSDGSGSESKSRMTAFEYVTMFLQFHANIHLNNVSTNVSCYRSLFEDKENNTALLLIAIGCEKGHEFQSVCRNLKKTEPMIIKLASSLPALIISEKFETWQLVQMVTICLFAIEHAWGIMDFDKNCAKFDETSLSPEELKSSSLVEELLASMLHSFLLPIHASLEPKETASYYTLPAVKIVLDWLLQKPQFLQREAITKNPQVWHGLCRLLNDLDVTTKEEFDIKKFEDIPLPEDWDLQAFLPLKKSQRRLKFSLNAAIPSEEESTWLRSIRLCELGEILAGVGNADKERLNLLSLSQLDKKRIFKAVHQAESLSEQVLLQIQELSVSPSNATTDTHLHKTTSSLENINRCPKPNGESITQQEVRFKLDDTQHRKEKSETERESNEKLERNVKDNCTNKEKRSGRQNIAMQTILQQRATQHGREEIKDTGIPLHQEAVVKQNSLQQNHPETAHFLLNSGNISSQLMNDVNTNRTPTHHMAPEQCNEFQLQIHSVGGVQPCERNETWFQQFNLHQSNITSLNQVARESNLPVPNYIQSNIPRIVRASTSNFNFQQSSIQQPQNPMLSKPVATPTGTFITNPPNVLWNYMSFMAPYQQGTNPTQPSTQIIVQQGSSPTTPKQSNRQQTSFYLVNGTQPELNHIDSTSNLLRAYRNAPGTSNLLQQPDMIRDQVQEHLTSQARLWQQNVENGRNDLGINQVVGRPVPQALQKAISAQQLQTSGGSSTVPHDLNSNTYSLFNSPWPPNMMVSQQPNSEGQHSTIEPLFMQSRIQSLWSGPGPSPLERLLEQQKQRRDGTTQ